MPTPRRIAVVNRGEAATRFLNTAADLVGTGCDLTTIALFTRAERHAAFVRRADEAVDLDALAERLGSAEATPYLNHALLRQALAECHADMVWLGWGFVAEDADFVAACAAQGITAIGPPPDAMRLLADKVRAKTLAESIGVPVTPWSHGPVSTLAEARHHAERIGYPLLVKSTAGGGGLGIREVVNAQALEGALDAARREAQRAFGDASVFLEKQVLHGRHVEVQILADAAGAVWPVGVRECSVQRRRQKVIEESGLAAPSPQLEAMLRERAVRIVRAAGYRNAGTVEFLVDPSGEAFFMEVNTRLQVEHTVTEMTTGLDLVAAQIKLALGERLEGSPPTPVGHAIEARVNAEDPEQGFAPSHGDVTVFRPAGGPGIRVDAGLTQGDRVVPGFDTMVAKVIAWAPDRPTALARLHRALRDTDLVIDGGATNQAFLLALVDHADVRRGAVSTRWLDETMARGGLRPLSHGPLALLAAAVVRFRRQQAQALDAFMRAARHGRLTAHDAPAEPVALRYAQATHSLQVFQTGMGQYQVVVDGTTHVPVTFEGARGPEVLLNVGGKTHRTCVTEDAGGFAVEIAGLRHRVRAANDGAVAATTPGMVVAVHVAVGDRVTAGQPLVTVESMKMESQLCAHEAGTITAIKVAPHAQVRAGDVVVEAESGDNEKIADSTGLDFSSLAARATPDAIDRLRSCILGLDDAGDAADLSAQLAADPGRPRNNNQVLRELDALQQLCELHAFQAQAYGSARMGDPAAEYLTRYLDQPEIARREQPDMAERLTAALRVYATSGAADDMSPAAHPLYLFRSLMRTAAIARLVTAILGRWLDQLQPADLPAQAASVLDRLAQVMDRRAPGVAALARSAVSRFFAETAAHQADSDDRLRLSCDAESPATTSDEVARRLELWRLRAFEVTACSARANTWLFAGTSREDPRDQRLFGFAEVHTLSPVRDGSGAITSVPELEEAIVRCLDAMRQFDTQYPNRSPYAWNRVTVYIEPTWQLPIEALRSVATHVAPAARGLSLDQLVIRMTRRQDDSDEDVLVHMVIPPGQGVQIGVKAPSADAISTLRGHWKAAAQMRRRGLVHPWEIVRLLTSPGVSHSDLPVGAFEELDLVEGSLAPVDREPGGNCCGVVVGLIRNVTPKHPEGMLRVAILNDPSQGMASLGEAECSRILAALRLAEQRAVPVEWYAVSSGARVSMDSGTENLDWTARVLRQIIEMTQRGHEINVILTGINVGAQSYWDAEATMLMHTRGILVAVADHAMVLTGKEALDCSGAVSAPSNAGIGGYDAVMGPNGEAQYWTATLEDACHLLFRHYEVSYRAPGENEVRRQPGTGPVRRTLAAAPHALPGSKFTTVGDIFSNELNSERKQPFDIRSVMKGLIDAGTPLERWADLQGGETAVVWDAHLDGRALTVVGIESRDLPRRSATAGDGPDRWSAGTLFPLSSKKVARALNAASGVRPVVVLANLSGFDGSPESMRQLQLEYGAEIGRAVVNFRGRILFCVLSRYHGGAFVVFSKALNDGLEVMALEGARASVIGGAPAAAVVFGRDVARRADADPRIQAARRRLDHAALADRPAAEAALAALDEQVRAETRGAVGREFDAIHTIERAQRVGSVDRIVNIDRLRDEITRSLGSQGPASSPASRPVPSR